MATSHTPSSHAEFAEKLAAQLSNARIESADLRFYALVDSAQQTKYPQALFAAYPGMPWQNLFAGNTEEAHLSVSPLLFDLNLESSTFINPGYPQRTSFLSRLARDGFEHPLFTLIASPLGIDELAIHFARYTHTELNTGDKVVLRFYDPRILPRFIQVLDDKQLAHFIAPIAHWWFSDRDGELKDIAGPALLPMPQDTPFMLTDAQENALAEVSLPERIINALRDEFETPFAQRSEYALYRDASMLVAAATKLGLSAWGDLRFFCTCGFATAVTFFEHPLVAKALLAMTKKEATLAEAIKSIPPETWDEIVSGKPSTKAVV